MSSPFTTQEVESIASLTLYDASHIAIPLAQTRHRFEIVRKWNIPKGTRVLELGCGQGDCTAVLAHVVGPSGHVTAIDPGPIDTYGSPYTLVQAQAHLSAGALGSRITFIEADPIDFLKSHPEAKYDFAVLVHCIWYFPSPNTLKDTLRALASHTPHVGIAEWALSASSFNATPHLLAVYAQASLYCRLPTSDSNIRTIMSPSAIKSVIVQCGMSLVQEQLVIPGEELQDAGWEVHEAMSDRFVNRVTESVDAEKERNVLYALHDSVRSSRDAVKARGEQVRCMDVWTGVLRTT